MPDVLDLTQGDGSDDFSSLGLGTPTHTHPQVGLSKAVKICQCREVTVTTLRDLPMQVDGEPWPQPKCVIKISRKKDPVRKGATRGGLG